MKTIGSIIKGLGTGEYDEILDKLYGYEKNGVQKKAERINRILDKYKETFDKEDDTVICLVSSPGRTEMIGNHMDHQGGCVITGTLILDILGAASISDTGRIRVRSGEDIFFEIENGDSEMQEEEKNTAKALVKGVVKKIKDLGFDVGGFDLMVDSLVPIGAGLSSSAAFEMLTGVVINRLFCRDRLTTEELAMAGQFAENEYFGKACGRMDQLACGLGGFEFIDFENKDNPVHEKINISFKETGLVLCIIDTGTEHSGLSDEFDLIPGEMSLAAEVFGKKRLCEVEESVFFENSGKIRQMCGDRAFLRGLHFYGERNRVRKASEALKTGDIECFTEMVKASGRSSFMYLQNADTYKDPVSEPVAVALALAEYHLKGKGACRIHGGGFAGSVLALVPEEEYEIFVRDMENALGKDSCRRMNIREKGTCCIEDM